VTPSHVSVPRVIRSLTGKVLCFSRVEPETLLVRPALQVGVLPLKGALNCGVVAPCGKEAKVVHVAEQALMPGCRAHIHG